MGLADLHIHTIFSYDGTASVPAVLKRAKQVGLDIIAITDHDEIRGALLAEELAPKFGIQVIPGVEITTAEGDLLALAIHEIGPGRAAADRNGSTRGGTGRFLYRAAPHGHRHQHEKPERLFHHAGFERHADAPHVS